MLKLDLIAWSAPVKILAFGLTLFALAKFLDKHLTSEWRSRLSQFIQTGQFHSIERKKRRQRPWQISAQTLSRFFSELLGSRRPTRFLFTSAVISAAIICSAFLYFFAIGDSTDREAIASLIMESKSFWLVFVTPLLATLVIDVLAAYQTMLFVEMTGKCRAFWQVIVLACGNVLVSVGLFSVTFPIMVVGLILFEDFQLHKGAIYLQPTLASQKAENKRFSIQYTFGRDSYDRLSESQIAKMHLWEIDTISADLQNVETSRHALRVLASPDYHSQEIVTFVTTAFEKLASDFHIKLLESRDTPNLFTLPHRTITLEVRNVLSSLSFSELYRTAFGATNLLTARSVQIVRGQLVSVESSNLILNLNGNLQYADTLKRKTDVLLICDGVFERIAGPKVDPASKISQCDKWAAISPAILRSHAASLTGQTTAQFFVAPFALSSLSMTLLVYTVCLSIIYASIVRALLPNLASKAPIKIENIPLTYAACIVFVFFIAPLAALVFVLF